MPRAKLQAMLNMTIAQIASGEADIATQKQMIEKLGADGISTGHAETVLMLLEMSVSVRRAERDRLEAALAGMS